MFGISEKDTPRRAAPLVSLSSAMAHYPAGLKHIPAGDSCIVPFIDATVMTNRLLHRYSDTPWWRRQERYWYATHGKGLEFLAERAMAHVGHNAPSEGCYGLKKDIDELVACIDAKLDAKDTTTECKNHFWEGSDY